MSNGAALTIEFRRCTTPTKLTKQARPTWCQRYAPATGVATRNARLKNVQRQTDVCRAGCHQTVHVDTFGRKKKRNHKNMFLSAGETSSHQCCVPCSHFNVRSQVIEV